MNLFRELITPLRAALDRSPSGPFYYPNRLTLRDIAFTHIINVDQKPGLSNLERVQDSPNAVHRDCTKTKATPTRGRIIVNITFLNNSSSDRLFYVSLRSQAPKQQYTVLSFSSAMRRHGHSHKLTSSRALRYYTVGIPFSDA